MDRIVLKSYEPIYEEEIVRITETQYYAVFKDFSTDSIKLIFQNNVLVGWVHLKLPESALFSGFVFIYITPPQRRKGLGTAVYSDAEKQFRAIGCNWWSSYPEDEASDKFVLSVGYDFVNTNSELEHSGDLILVNEEGIRACRGEMPA